MTKTLSFETRSAEAFPTRTSNRSNDAENGMQVSRVLVELKGIRAAQKRMESMLLRLQQAQGIQVPVLMSSEGSSESCAMPSDPEPREAERSIAPAMCDKTSVVRFSSLDPEQEAPMSRKGSKESSPSRHSAESATPAITRQSSGGKGNLKKSFSSSSVNPSRRRASDEELRGGRSAGKGSLNDTPVYKSSSSFGLRGSCESNSGSGELGFISETHDESSFVAATLPLSWPTVLAPKSVYEKERNMSAMMMIRSTVASIRLTGVASQSTDDFNSLRKKRWHSFVRRFLISPGSHTHMVLSALSFMVLMYDFTVIPVALAWDLEMSGLLYITSWLSVIFWTMDMGATFMTAFQRKGELVFHPAQIAKRYLKSWFPIDFLAVGGDWFSILLQAMSGDMNASSMRTMRLIKVARLIRIVGVLRMLRFMNVVREYVEKQCSGYYRVGMKTASLLFGILLLTHTFACAWFALGKLGPSDTGVRWTDMFFLDTNSPAARAEDTYQYLVSFHWAAAQMTLGATDVPSANSSERLFNVLCMLCGLIFSCTLVSSLSATLVDFQMAHKDQNQKMELLRRYLKDHMITTTTCMLVQDQITERLLEEKNQPSHPEQAEAVILKLLSSRLFAQLRFEVFRWTINSHPLLQIWGHIHMPSLHKLCVDALSFTVLNKGDDLFAAGGWASAAYYVEQGQLEYTQHPDSSPVTIESSTVVNEGTWLCEAALWSEWIHVGTAVALKRCKLAVVNSEAFLKVCAQHVVVKTVVISYGETFHRRIVQATPPEVHWPNDLQVPHSSFAEIVISMPREAQVAIGMSLVQRAMQSMGFSAWAAKALGAGSHYLDALEEDIVSGRCVVIQKVGEDIERVVAVTCVRFENTSAEVLVQIAKQEDDGILYPVCQLPGKQCENDAPYFQQLSEVIEVKLPLLVDKVELVGVERSVKEENSRGVSMKTTYFRTIISAQLLEEWDVVPMAKPDAHVDMATASTGSAGPLTPGHATASRTSKRSGNKGGHYHFSSSDQSILEGLLMRDVFNIVDVNNHCGLYCWLPEETYDYLFNTTPGRIIMKQWVNTQLCEMLELQHSNHHRRRSTRGSFMSRASRHSHRSTRSSGLDSVSFPLDYDSPTASRVLDNTRPSMAKSRSARFTMREGQGSPGSVSPPRHGRRGSTESSVADNDSEATLGPEGALQRKSSSDDESPNGNVKCGSDEPGKLGSEDEAARWTL